VRVCFANHSTAPVNLGGAERSLIRFVEDWQARDPDLTPVFLTKAPRGKFIEAIERRGWSYRAYRFRGWAVPSPQPAPAAERAAFATADYAAVTAIIRDFERDRPDLVVTNTVVAPWASFAAAVLGIPQAWFVREYGDLDHGLQFQEGPAATFADIGLFSGAVITNSAAMREYIGQWIDPKKISVAYPVVDGEALLRSRTEPPEREPFPQPDPGLKVTVVGRVEPGKGQHRVIDALGELRRRGIPASACFVGSWKDPGYDLQLRDRARALGVEDRITFVGEQAQTAPFISAADVCATPSTLEAFGRSTAEYMVLGKPVVASSSGGSAELIATEDQVRAGTAAAATGAVFEPDDIDGFADALAQYANNPDLVWRHGSAAPDRLASIVGAGHDNDAAIDRLASLIGTEGYSLPQIARYWFELPGAYASLGATNARAAAGLLVARLRSRSGLVGRVMRQPLSQARRLIRR
jgi:glycosyltransferase involved in cell wall biosynthesis